MHIFPIFETSSLLNKKSFLSTKEFNNEIILVNFFASWCVPCRVEHTFMQILSNEGVKIIGINYKDDPQQAIKWLEELGNPYSKILVDTDGINSIELGAYGVPETFLFDPKSKKIIKKYIGPINDINFKEIVKIIKNEKI